MNIYDALVARCADECKNVIPFVTAAELEKKSSLYDVLYDKSLGVFSESSDDESEESEEDEEDCSKKKNGLENIEGDLDLTNEALIRCHQIGVYIPGLQLRLKLPKKSTLNLMEHSEYLRLRELVNSKPVTDMTFTEKRDLHVFTILSKVVMQEQQEFVKYVRSQWPRLAYRRRFHSTWVQRYVKELWQHCLTRVFSYPRLYSSFGGPIPLVYPNSRPEVHLDWVQDLLVMGQPKKYIFQPPPGKCPVRLCDDFSKMIVAYHLSDSGHDINNLYKVPVSKDKNAEFLAGVHNIDVVISSSGLKTIAANNLESFDKSWDIPVIVKELKFKENGVEKTRRVVFLDKALPPKNMTAYEMNLWWFKRAVKLRTLESRGKTVDTKTDWISISKPPQLINSNAAESSNSATIPKVTSSSATNAVCKGKKVDSFEHGDESESDNLVIDEELSENVKRSSLLADLSLSSSPDTGSSPSSNEQLTPIVSVMEQFKTEKCDSKDKETKIAQGMMEHMAIGKSNPKDKETLTVQLSEDSRLPMMVPPPETHISYRWWKLSPARRTKEDFREDYLKGVGSSREINLLVRSKIDGLQGEDDSAPVTVVPKLEYQYDYGAESSTPSEIIQQWTSLQFRPFCKIARVRIDPMTSEVMMLQWVTQQSLVGEALQHKIKIRPFVNGTLYSVFSHLVDLPVGYYLLSHSSRNTGFADLLCHNPDGGNYNLNDYLRVDTTQITEEVVPWPGIDTNLLTPVNEYLKSIPGMFLPRRYKVNINANTNQKKKKKKKNKNKNSNNLQQKRSQPRSSAPPHINKN